MQQLYKSMFMGSELPAITRTLMWCEEYGFGYYPVDPSTLPYDEDYFNRYAGYETTALGKALTSKRVELVNKYIGNDLMIDIGIGSGAFIKQRPNTFGHDVNQEAVRWLLHHKKYAQPFSLSYQHASFWDVLEHIPDPRYHVINRRFVFTSLPIFKSIDHVLTSKHFRRDEHYWYWTEKGLVAWFDRLGFNLEETNAMESELGREDIQTFVFKKRGI